VEHISGEMHTTGEAVYTDDINAPAGILFIYNQALCSTDTLHLQFVLSTEAHADIIAIDMDEAQTMPGVVRILTHKDCRPNATHWNNGKLRKSSFQTSYIIEVMPPSLQLTKLHTTDNQ
jgi:xanthine dehydrogenase molybdopterin-binding subunit B